MMYELATLSLRVGTTPAAVPAIGAWVREGAGTLAGCWSSDIGTLNQVAVLRAFASPEEQAAEQARALHSPSPFGCAEFLTGIAVDRYLPFPDRPPVVPGLYGPVYEIRTYQLVPGGLSGVVAAWTDALPARTVLSPLVMVMHTLDGPSRFTHIWPYRDLNTRAAIRAEAIERGIWPPKSGPRISAMTSTIYLPTTISPLT